MAKLIKIKKGLTLNLKGKAPEEMLANARLSSTYALVPDDFEGVIPKVLVKPGEKVLAGTPLMFHKSFPEMKFTSPVSGEVVGVNRGAKRKVLSIEVRPDANTEYQTYNVSNAASLDAEATKALLLESGMWGFIKQRPYDMVANPHEAPRDIFITANFTAPLAPKFDFLLQGEEAAFELALKAIAKLTSGKVYLGIAPGSKVNAQGVELITMDGPHPAGNVGVMINKVAPINRNETVWTLKATDLIVIGRFLQTGKTDFTRKIALTGSDAKEHGYINMVPGCNIFSALDGRLTIKNDHERVIAGNVLTGKKMTADAPFISLDTDQITVIPEGDDVDEFFGWATPGFGKYSFSRSYFSWLGGKNKEYEFDARVKGGERAMIMSSEYHRVFPMDIYPEFLLKAIIAFDITKMENLGIYEVAPEDFALCEFVDTSKIELQRIVRQGLNELYKEMN